MKNATQFAGFEYPKSLYFLPSLRLPLADRLHKKAESRKFTSGYYQNEPSANKHGQFFYLESDFMPGLRWNWCDEINGARIDHTGWYSNDSQDEKIRGLIMRLPHNRGFVAGWSMGKSMASYVDTRTVWEDEIECAYDADRMAEIAAEKEREYQTENSKDEDESQ